LEEDLSLFNFERLKWGGLRHLDPAYATFDLERFTHEEPLEPTREDVALLRALLSSIEAAPDGTTAAKLEAQLPDALPSNREERAKLIGILGLCGILGTPEHPSFRAAFVPASERALPARAHVDMSYPACWWTATDGIDRGSVEEWFGHLL
jgi:alkanesulfonate monooxygenase SsuD/methylene tetrahydromethanopterin reductase-like flavin-dependent oxidoreductase (luciferase family)